VATAALYFVGPGSVVLGIVLYVVASIGFEGGYVFYNSFLPDVSTPETIGRVSGWAWAVGYAGGLLSLAMCFPLIKRPLRDAAGALDPIAVSHRQISFILVAVFFLVFAIPAFVWLRESAPQGRLTGFRDYVGVGFRRTAETLRHLSRYRETGKFILASLFFTDGITTVISFSAIYATTTFHFTSGDLVILFLVLNVVAFPGSLVAGILADRFGDRTHFSIETDLMLGVNRDYRSFTSALEEVKNARVFAGIHFRTACDDGQTLGRSVAAYVLDNALPRDH
jgi:UMF1 family MFS transporter